MSSPAKQRLRRQLGRHDRWSHAVLSQVPHRALRSMSERQATNLAQRVIDEDYRQLGLRIGKRLFTRMFAPALFPQLLERHPDTLLVEAALERFDSEAAPVTTLLYPGSSGSFFDELGPLKPRE